MHVRLQSCTMNANDANTVKFLVVQSQNYISIDRQTGQLLAMPVEMSSHTAQNVVCPLSIRNSSGAWTWSVHALVVVISRWLKCPNSVFHLPGLAFSSPSNSNPRSAIFQFRHFLPLAIWSVIFQVLHFSALLFGRSFSSMVWHFPPPLLYGPLFSRPAFSGPVFQRFPTTIYVSRSNSENLKLKSHTYLLTSNLI